MNQELKQRIIGAIVVTALAAIFIPMLFDDPIENSGQSVSELAIPATPLNSNEVSANKLPSNANQVLNVPDNASETLVNTEEESELSKDTQLSEEIPANDDPTVDNTDEDIVAQADSKSKNSNTPPSLDTGVVETHKPSVSKKALPELAKQEPTPEPVWEEEKAIEVPAELVNTTKTKTKTKTAPIKVKIKSTAPIKTATPENIISKKITTTEKPLPVKAVITDKPTVVPTKPKAELSRWTIQVGSFSKKENATTLMETLRKQNLPVTLDTIKSANDGLIYRLKIGPTLEKKRAIEMKTKLDALKIQSFLISE
jgi:DedD protein